MIINKTVIYRGKTVTFEQLKNHSVIPLEVECDYCHKHFNSTKYQIVRNGHQLCQACAILNKRGKSMVIGEKHNRLVVIESITPSTSRFMCDCGNIIIRKNADVRNGHIKSCGCLQKEEASKNISNCHVKERHPNWKGGITPERNRIESTKEYKDLKKATIEKYGNKCPKCDVLENLQIHHILDFANHPDLRLDPSNVICLCKSCHRSFHNLYGNNTANEQNLIEFLS